MPAALEISSLQKTYANGFEALKGIDLNVQEGDFLRITWPNGAGKSTTIGIVSSLVSSRVGKFASAASISMTIFHWRRSR